MAEGGEDIEMADARNFPLPEEDESIFKTSIFDEKTEYNTIDNSNLIAPETPGSPKSSDLSAEVLSINNKQDIISKALKDSSWQQQGIFKGGYTDRGVELLAAKAKFDKNGNLYVDKNDIKVYLYSKGGKMYSESTLKNYYGTNAAEEIKDILTTEEPEMEPLGGETILSSPALQETNESIFIKKVDESGANPQTTLSEINSLLDTPEDVLRSVGFSEPALREINTLKNKCDNIAAIKRERTRKLKKQKIK